LIFAFECSIFKKTISASDSVLVMHRRLYYALGTYTVMAVYAVTVTRPTYAVAWTWKCQSDLPLGQADVAFNGSHVRVVGDDHMFRNWRTEFHMTTHLVPGALRAEGATSGCRTMQMWVGDQVRWDTLPEPNATMMDRTFWIHPSMIDSLWWTSSYVSRLVTMSLYVMNEEHVCHPLYDKTRLAVPNIAPEHLGRPLSVTVAHRPGHGSYSMSPSTVDAEKRTAAFVSTNFVGSLWI
jgi:hypothetical protein